MGIIISIALLITFFFTHNSNLAIAAGLFWIAGDIEFILSFLAKVRDFIVALTKLMNTYSKDKED